MNVNRYKFYDNFREKEIENINTLKFDREGNLTLIVYTDKKINEHLTIPDSEKQYCCEFEILKEAE